MQEKRFSRVCLSSKGGTVTIRAIRKSGLPALAGLAVMLLTPLSGAALFKSFDIASAIVNYEINGSSQLSTESNVTISGRSTLLFTDWGARKLYKEKYTEMTTGPMKSTKIYRTLYREEFGEVFRVDFEKNRIEKGENALLKKAITTGENLYQKRIEEMKANGKPAGSSTVLGFHCDEWIYKGTKRCFYKGVPLKEELTISGVKVVKRAISAQFDLNISDDAFAFPDFEENEQLGYLLEKKKEIPLKSKVKTAASARKAPDTGPIEGAVLKNEAIADEGDDVAENVFREQKELLPKLLEEMEEARVCLENVENKSEANGCLFKLVEIEEKMSGEKSDDREVTLWNDAIRENVLDDLEEGILDMKRRMPCIRRSRNFDDLSACMADPQED